jgi:hypothetical protein
MSRMKIVVSIIAMAVCLLAISENAMAQTPNLNSQDNGPCTDKWINYAYRTELNRAPVGRGGAGECNIYLYKAGSWNNYGELRSAVVTWNAIRQRSGIDIRTVNSVYKLFKQNRQVEAQLKAVAGSLTRILDLMGNVINQYKTGDRSLLDTGSERIEIGNGTSVLIK